MAGNISPVPGSESQHVCVCSVTSVMSDPMDSSPPGSFVHGILQARMLEWAAIPFSRGYFQSRDQTRISYDSYLGRRVLYY